MWALDKYVILSNHLASQRPSRCSSGSAGATLYKLNPSTMSSQELNSSGTSLEDVSSSTNQEESLRRLLHKKLPKHEPTDDLVLLIVQMVHGEQAVG
jgi:hypothetical protein